MRIKIGPIEILFGAIAVVGAILSMPALMILAIAAIVVSLGIKANQINVEVRRGTFEDDLNPEARTLLRPVRKLHEDIVEIVDKNKDSSAVKIIGGQAVEESKKILEHCANILKIRSQVKKVMQGEYEAKKAIQGLEEQLQSATSDQERQSLTAALAARNLEMQHYREQEQVLTQVETNLKQAEAALSEMKARLSVAATAAMDTSKDQELDETILRLQSLSSSFDEAEDLLRERVR